MNLIMYIFYFYKQLIHYNQVLLINLKHLYYLLLHIQNYHKLNNLIWVWNANEVRSSDIGEYEEFFPGLDVVDILATDVYSGKYPKSEYEQLKNMAQGKPIAIGECGPLPPVEVLKEQPGWCWFMCWAGFLLDANSPEKIKGVYNYEGVRNLK